jgi:predicted Zn-dependent protease with MMP-like domain
VQNAVGKLPPEFIDKLRNIDVVVQDLPSHRQLKSVQIGPSGTLLGLYEGVPQTKRGLGYGLVPPDKITIFRKPIIMRCRNEAEILDTVQRVVRHEIAHHFGISDAKLRQIERS